MLCKFGRYLLEFLTYPGPALTQRFYPVLGHDVCFVPKKALIMLPFSFDKLGPVRLSLEPARHEDVLL